MVPRSHTYNQGHSTWVTLLWYLSFSLPMLFCNGFSVELSKIEANIERDRKKEVEHNMSTIFLQLTQVLMSQIVVKNFATLCCIRKIHSLHKTKTFVSTFYKHKLHLLALLSLFTYLTYTRNLKNFPFWAEPPPAPVGPGLSKVAGCFRKSPFTCTWFVMAGYSAWHFFTDGVF